MPALKPKNQVALTISLILLLSSPESVLASGPRYMGDFNILNAALRMYRTNTGSYPSATEGLNALINRPSSQDENSGWVRLMDEIPCDPWQEPYHYVRSKSLPNTFGLYSTGPNMVTDLGNPDSDDICSWVDREPYRTSNMEPAWLLPSVIGVAIGAAGTFLAGLLRNKSPQLKRGN